MTSRAMMRAPSIIRHGAHALAALIAFAAAFGALPARAEWAPSQTIEFVVMAGEGGGADKAARFIAKAMADQKLVPVAITVVNKAGKSGAEALAYLKSRKGADNVILFTLNSYYTTPLEQPDLGIDIAQFAPVGRLAEDVFLLWVNAERTDINTVDDFVKAVKAKGGEWIMAGTGTGAEDSLLTDFLNATYGLRMSYKPFKGGGEVARELAEKRADSTVNNPSEQDEFYPKGLTKPIAAFSAQRLAGYPRVPALRETGMEFHYLMQRSVVGPPGMTKDAESYYQRLFQRFFDSPTWQQYRTKNSLAGAFLTGEGLRQYWMREREKHMRWKMALDIMLPKKPAGAAKP